MSKYVYKGPVMVFDRCVQDEYVGTTIAPTEKRARSNIAYRWKVNNNLVANAQVTLPGEIRRVS